MFMSGYSQTATSITADEPTDICVHRYATEQVHAFKLLLRACSAQKLCSSLHLALHDDQVAHAAGSRDTHPARNKELEVAPVVLVRVGEEIQQQRVVMRSLPTVGGMSAFEQVYGSSAGAEPAAGTTACTWFTACTGSQHVPGVQACANDRPCRDKDKLRIFYKAPLGNYVSSCACA